MARAYKAAKSAKARTTGSSNRKSPRGKGAKPGVSASHMMPDGKRMKNGKHKREMDAMMASGRTRGK